MLKNKFDKQKKNSIMRRYIYLICFVIAVVLSSCSEWLHEPSPGSTELKDFFTVGETAIQSVNAAYAPLMWEYNHTYYSEWFIGDVMSDDALKGGQNIGDMADAYDMENWKTNTNNTLIIATFNINLTFFFIFLYSCFTDF